MTQLNRSLNKLDTEIASPKISRQVAIIGGNPCFRQMRDNKYKISRQMAALEAALVEYNKLRDQNCDVSFSILIDHKITQKDFLKDGAKNRRIPTLDDLIPQLQNLYKQVLNKYKVSEKEVFLIFEGQCALRFREWLKKPIDLNLKSQLEKIEFESFKDAACQARPSLSESNGSSKKRDCFVYLEPINIAPEIPKFNCRCIFAYTFKKANEYAQLQNKKGQIIAFWGDDSERCDKTVIEGGIDIVKKYFKEVISPIQCFYNIPLGKNDDVYVEL